MLRKYYLALTVLGAFFLIAAGPAQAGWGHSSDSSSGESMSTEATPEGTFSSSDQETRDMESSEYQKEEAVETGRLPESEGFESNEPATEDIGGVLYRGGVDAGP